VYGIWNIKGILITCKTSIAAIFATNCKAFSRISPGKDKQCDNMGEDYSLNIHGAMQPSL